VPLLAFVTRIPFYRDLSVGDRGPDVTALEHALIAAGKLESADGVFDARDAAALNRLYADAGVGHVTALQGRLRLASSVSVPAGSVVEEIRVGVGDTVSPRAPLMILTADATSLTCRVPGDVHLSVGQTLKLSGPGHESVRVRSVGVPDTTTGQRQVVVAPSRPTTSEAPMLLIAVDATPGPVLTAPAGAIWIGADGRLVVRKLVGKAVHIVPVEVGISAGGWAEISGPSLAAGDRLVLNAAQDVLSGPQTRTQSP